MISAPIRRSMLTISDLPKVRNETFTARSKWYDIGLELGVSEDTLECIEKENVDISSQFRAMYSHWLKMVNPKPTWEALVEALEQPAIAKYSLATTLRQKYCPNAKKRRQKPSDSTVHHAQCQKAFKLIWRLILLLAVLFLAFSTGYNNYFHRDSDSDRDQLPRAIDENEYQRNNHASNVKINPKRNVKVKLLSRTLPRGNKRVSFFGRDVELRNLTELIKPTSQACIISITGSPGFGKSTLAIHAGYEAEEIGYSVVYVDIADMHKVDLVKQEIINSVQIEEEVSHKYSKVTDWATSIEKTTVLILDNCDTALHDQMDEFRSLLKSLCRYSSYLKVITTAKQETLFLGTSFERIQIHELQSRDAVRVLTEITSSISPELAHKLAKLVGNVPLALQVIGTLLKENSNLDDEVFSGLQNNIIEALSPEELPVEDRVNTSMSLSYQYLPQSVQFCGCVLSKFPKPGIVKESTAHFVLSNVTLHTDHSPWKFKDTQQCLKLLVKRSLLTINHADKLYKFHQLVREFFHYKQIQREQESPINAFILNTLFNMSFESYSLQKFGELLKVLNRCKDSSDLDLVRHLYIETMKELPNHKQQYIWHQVINSRQLAANPLHNSFLVISFKQRYYHSHFNHYLCVTYLLQTNLEIFQFELLIKFGSVEYFNNYVTNLIALVKLETHSRNTSYSLLILRRKFASVTELYDLASHNISSGLASHGIFAKYYATQANMCIRLNDFDCFMECWQRILYLTVFKMKCEKRRCTRVQSGLAAFGKGNYRLAVLFLKPHLYSQTGSLPLFRRARLFVLVCYSYIKLGEWEHAEKLLLNDFVWLKNIQLQGPQNVFLFEEDPSTSYYRFADWNKMIRMIKKDRTSVPTIRANINYGLNRDLPIQSISYELPHAVVSLEDYLDYLNFDLNHLGTQTDRSCRELCRTMMIFGSFLEKHANMTNLAEIRKTGTKFKVELNTVMHEFLQGTLLWMKQHSSIYEQAWVGKQ